MTCVRSINITKILLLILVVSFLILHCIKLLLLPNMVILERIAFLKILSWRLLINLPVYNFNTSCLPIICSVEVRRRLCLTQHSPFFWDEHISAGKLIVLNCRRSRLIRCALIICENPLRRWNTLKAAAVSHDI